MADTENEKIRGPEDAPIAVEQVGGKGGTSKYNDQREVEYPDKARPPINEKSPISGGK